MTDSIHSCGYHCRIPACVLAQRDELVSMYVAQPVQPIDNIYEHQARDAEFYRLIKAHSRNDLCDLGAELEWYQPTPNLDVLMTNALFQYKASQRSRKVCFCDTHNIVDPDVSCGDCPMHDYKQNDQS